MKLAPLLKEEITQYLPEYPVILEAGAHIGRDTLKMIKLWPQAKIHAFEPVSNLYTLLVTNTRQYPSISTYPYALSNKSGAEPFYISSGASSAVSSLFEPDQYIIDRPEVFFNQTTVTTLSLDDWARENKIDHVDFMWLDMQGAELKVLEASKIVFPTVRVIVLEANLTQRFKSVPLLDEVSSFMRDKGFIIVLQDPPKHNKSNLLCVRKEFLKEML